MNDHYHHPAYRARIFRAIDFIQSNLDRPITLREAAKSACFSPFYFHRIFSAVTGETLTSFIQRLKMERAAMRLIASPEESITGIALDLGYASSASFARLFRDHFGMSATQWRNGGARTFRHSLQAHDKNDQTNSKNGKDAIGSSCYFDTMHDEAGAARDNLVSAKFPQRSDSMAATPTKPVVIERMDPVTVAYVRHIGPYKGDVNLFGNLWGRLMRWAQPRGLLRQPDLQCLSVYNDDPELTDENKLRVSVCITVSPDTATSGEVGAMDLPGGDYAVAHFELDADQYQDAWNYVFGEWLPGSGYQPDDRPCFERCCNDPSSHPEHKHIVDICIPVKPL
jgi:AraC family transcriptional regulator